MFEQDTQEVLTPRQEKARASRAHIAKVALRLFAVQGFAATSTRQIAKEAGVSEGLIFRYFPSKMALLLDIAKTRQTFAGGMAALLAEASQTPVIEVMNRVAESYVELIYNEIHFLNMMLSESRSNDELYDMFNGLMNQTAEKLASYIESRKALGEVRADFPSLHAAQAFFGSLVLFFLTHKHLTQDQWLEQASTYVNDVVEVWLNGALA